MAKTPETTTHTGATTEQKVKRTRSPSEPKAIYAVVQLLGEDGEPLHNASKAQVRILSFEKSAEKVLEIVESGRHPGALFLRGMLPAGR